MGHEQGGHNIFKPSQSLNSAQAGLRIPYLYHFTSCPRCYLVRQDFGNSEISVIAEQQIF